MSNPPGSLLGAVVAAGIELRDRHDWGLDEDDHTPVEDSLFARVVMSHLAPLIEPDALRLARIAALRAELAALEDAP